MHTAANILKKHEGFSPSLYDDRHPDGRKVGQAIGYGRNLTRNPLDEDEATFLLVHQLDKIDKDFKNRLSIYHRLGYVRQQTLCMMAYQMGVSGVLTFKRMIHALTAGEFSKAAHECLDSRWARNFPGRATEIAGILYSGEFSS